MVNIRLSGCILRRNIFIIEKHFPYNIYLFYFLAINVESNCVYAVDQLKNTITIDVQKDTKTLETLNSDCFWTLTAAKDKRLALNEFQYVFGYAGCAISLTISESATRRSKKFVKLCGTGTQGRITSTNNTIHLHFVATAIFTRFQMKYELEGLFSKYIA